MEFHDFQDGRWYVKRERSISGIFDTIVIYCKFAANTEMIADTYFLCDDFEPSDPQVISFSATIPKFYLLDKRNNILESYRELESDEEEEFLRMMFKKLFSIGPTKVKYNEVWDYN